jgi:DNA-binding LytR/AlgR family response regulator
MKVRVELTDGTEEDEVVIRCGRVDETVRKLCRYVAEQTVPELGLTFYKRNREYYFPLDSVLFFETEGESVYAHTIDDAYLIKHRLYELEQMLPRDFVRVSKSTIVNVRKIYSVTRDLSSSSLIQFQGSHKQIYASRHYYRELRQRLQERSRHET